MLHEAFIPIKFMNRLIVSLGLTLGVLSFIGCQATIYGTASQFNNMRLGMNKEEVINLLGQPVSTAADADKHEEYLVYKKMKHAISEWPRTYQVTLRDGKVVKWGEQYEEKNVNQF